MEDIEPCPPPAPFSLTGSPGPGGVNGRGAQRLTAALGLGAASECLVPPMKDSKLPFLSASAPRFSADLVHTKLSALLILWIVVISFGALGRNCKMCLRFR